MCPSPWPQVTDLNDTPILVGFAQYVPEEYLHAPRLPFRPLQNPIFTLPWHDDDPGQNHTFIVHSGNVGTWWWGVCVVCASASSWESWLSRVPSPLHHASSAVRALFQFPTMR